MSLAHVTHNTSMIMLHQKIGYPDSKLKGIPLPNFYSAETCHSAAVETSNITRNYLRHSSTCRPLSPHWAFCIFASAKILLGKLDLEATRTVKLVVNSEEKFIIGSILRISARIFGLWSSVYKRWHRDGSAIVQSNQHRLLLASYLINFNYSMPARLQLLNSLARSTTDHCILRMSLTAMRLSIHLREAVCLRQTKVNPANLPHPLSSR